MAGKKAKARKTVNKPDIENLKPGDVLCPICRTILIEPVTLPCNHGFCKLCFNGTMENANLVCPLCRIRVGSWFRIAKKQGKLVDEVLWGAIQSQYPKEVQNKYSGIDNSIEEEQSVIIVATPGEIRKEYELQRQQDQVEQRKIQEAEEKASAALIKKLKEEEDYRQAVEEEKLKLDAELAKKLSQELKASTSKPVLKKIFKIEGKKYGPMDRFVTSEQYRPKKLLINNFEAVQAIKSDSKLSNSFTKLQEYACHVLPLDKTPINPNLITVHNKLSKSVNSSTGSVVPKKVQKIHKNIDVDERKSGYKSSGSGEASDVIDAECRYYFKPIEPQKRWHVPGIVPVRVSLKKATESVNPEIKAPSGKIAILIRQRSHISAFAKFNSPEQTPKIECIEIIDEEDQPHITPKNQQLKRKKSGDLTDSPKKKSRTAQRHIYNKKSPLFCDFEKSAVVQTQITKKETSGIPKSQSKTEQRTIFIRKNSMKTEGSSLFSGVDKSKWDKIETEKKDSSNTPKSKFKTVERDRLRKKSSAKIEESSLFCGSNSLKVNRATAEKTDSICTSKNTSRTAEKQTYTGKNPGTFQKSPIFCSVTKSELDKTDTEKKAFLGTPETKFKGIQRKIHTRKNSRKNEKIEDLEVDKTETGKKDPKKTTEMQRQTYKRKNSGTIEESPMFCGFDKSEQNKIVTKKQDSFDTPKIKLKTVQRQIHTRNTSAEMKESPLVCSPVHSDKSKAGKKDSNCIPKNTTETVQRKNSKTIEESSMSCGFDKLELDNTETGKKDSLATPKMKPKIVQRQIRTRKISAKIKESSDTLEVNKAEAGKEDFICTPEKTTETVQRYKSENSGMIDESLTFCGFDKSEPDKTETKKKDCLNIPKTKPKSVQRKIQTRRNSRKNGSSPLFCGFAKSEVDEAKTEIIHTRNKKSQYVQRQIQMNNNCEQTGQRSPSFCGFEKSDLDNAESRTQELLKLLIRTENRYKKSVEKGCTNKSEIKSVKSSVDKPDCTIILENLNIPKKHQNTAEKVRTSRTRYLRSSKETADINKTTPIRIKLTVDSPKKAKKTMGAWRISNRQAKNMDTSFKTMDTPIKSMDVPFKTMDNPSKTMDSSIKTLINTTVKSKYSPRTRKVNNNVTLLSINGLKDYKSRTIQEDAKKMQAELNLITVSSRTRRASRRQITLDEMLLV